MGSSLSRAGAASPRRAASRRVFGRDFSTAVLFLLPMLVVLLGLIAYPFVSAILLTLQDKRVGLPGEWVGLRNYAELFSNTTVGESFRASIWNTVVYTGVAPRRSMTGCRRTTRSY